MKVFNYIILTLGIVLVLHFAGIDTGSTIVDIVGLNENGLAIDSSAFYNYLFGTGGILLALGVGLGIVAGFFTQQKYENFIILPFIGAYLVNFTTALFNIVKYSLSASVPRWIGISVLCILGPLTIGLVFSLVEFFRGTD